MGRVSGFDAVADEIARDAEAAGGGGDIVVFGAEGLLDDLEGEVAEFLFEIERLFGQLPARVEDGLAVPGLLAGGHLLGNGFWGGGIGLTGGGGGIGEIGELDPVIIGEDDLAFEFVHEFPDIARP